MKTLLTLQLTIFLLVAVGFLMKKIHIIGPQGQKNINDLVIYLILPCNILHAFTQSAADGDFMNYLEILLISIGIQVFCVIYGKVMFKGEAEGRYKCLQYGTICSNAGFLGNPIAEGIYGMEGLVLASVYLIPQRNMMWSSGLAVFSGTNDKMKTLKKILKKKKKDINYKETNLKISLILLKKACQKLIKMKVIIIIKVPKC